jgi:hypothetical protein
MPKNFHRIVVLKLQLMWDEDLKVDKIDSKEGLPKLVRRNGEKRKRQYQKFSPFRRAEISNYG